MLLALCAGAGLVGGYVGATSPLMVGIFSTWLGWIVALLVINILPRVAISYRNSGSIGVAVLMADGFVSGLVLAPILALAAYRSPDIILSALAITALVFGAVTMYVFTTKRSFSAPRGLMIGLIVAIFGAMLLNGFLQLGSLGVLISLGVGVFGVLSLVYSTGQVLRSSDADSPIPMALMLFAGLFNVFVSTLNILLSLGGGGRRD